MMFVPSLDIFQTRWESFHVRYSKNCSNFLSFLFLKPILIIKWKKKLGFLQGAASVQSFSKRFCPRPNLDGWCAPKHMMDECIFVYSSQTIRKLISFSWTLLMDFVSHNSYTPSFQSSQILLIGKVMIRGCAYYLEVSVWIFSAENR